MANKRLVNGIVEVGGLKLVGTVKSWDIGGTKNDPMVNGDKSVHFVESITPAMLEIDVSVVNLTDTEQNAIPQIMEQPMLLSFPASGAKVNFPAMTFSEKGPVSDAGVMNVKFAGPPVGA